MLSVWRCDRNNLAMDEINIFYTSSSLLMFITSTTVREKGYDFLMSLQQLIRQMQLMSFVISLKFLFNKTDATGTKNTVWV